MERDRRQHWDKVFTKRKRDELSWYQHVPETSLNLINVLGLPAGAGIIDIGSGDSALVDNLLPAGYTDITALDISAKALDRARERLGDRAGQVNWVVSDVLDFTPARRYDLWHDRAAFHFLTEKEDIGTYVGIVAVALSPGGYLVLGTFSDEGPDTCSGLPVTRYTEDKMTAALSECFRPVAFTRLTHITPSGSEQAFLFGTFIRNERP